MTALDPRVSQPSQGLVFIKTSSYTKESGEGYLIRVVRCGGDWCYLAYAPEEKIVKECGVQSHAGLKYRVTYAIGERVPPATGHGGRASVTIGSFPAHEFASTDDAISAAEQACNDHYQVGAHA